MVNIEEKLEKNLKDFFGNNKKEKVIFIGAGLSKNLGLPSWEEFGDIHLDFLRSNYSGVDFEVSELLKKDDFRTVMSLTKGIIFNDYELKIKLLKEYEKIFKIVGSDKEKQVKKLESIFRKVYNLGLINITTNYDDILDLLANEENKELTNKEFFENKMKQKVFYTEQDFNKIMKEENLKLGSVYHIHGSINDIDNMIISNEDYIMRYWCENNIYKKFIKLVFEKYDVIFLGYGLKELEILNYLFEKSPVKKTINRRVVIVDCFDYEYKKIELLEKYYWQNYSIKLCPYSKSQKGFGALVDVIDKINKVKNDMDSKYENRIRGLNLLKEDSWSENDLKILLQSISEYPDLQSAFFSKIHGNPQYLESLEIEGFFNSKKTNILAILSYINSIHMKEEVGNSQINAIYSLVNENLEEYHLSYDYIIFLLKYHNKILNFNLDNLLDTIKNDDFEFLLVQYFIRESNFEIILNFWKKNQFTLIRLINCVILKNKLMLYTLEKNERLLKIILKFDKEYFVKIFIDNYEKMYIKNTYENDYLYLEINNQHLSIMSKKQEFDLITIQASSLKQIYLELKDLNIKNENEVRKGISALFNKEAYSSIFDNLVSFNNENEKFLEKLFNLSEDKRNFLDLLFNSKVYYLKKISLYLIVKYDMVEFIVSKVKKKSFELRYIIQNSEFSGELKEVFRLINNSPIMVGTDEQFLLECIMEGEFIKYGKRDSESISRWKYIRLKELQNLQLLKLEYLNIENNVQFDYELVPLIGACKVERIESIPKVDLNKVKNYDIYSWVKWMNEYKEEKCKEFLIEYDIKEDIKVFINNLKNNLVSYMNDFEYLINIRDYQWLYYILSDINDDLKYDKNIFLEYYSVILNFIKSYLKKLTNIFDEPDRHSVSKKNLVAKICDTLISILKNSKNYLDDDKETYQEIVKRLEILIEDQDDFNKTFGDDNNFYSSYINSIHYSLLNLEFVFIVSDYYLDDEFNRNNHFNKFVSIRRKKSEKEFYIFLGQSLWNFNNLSEDLTKDLVRNMEDKNIAYFLSGIAYLDVINEKLYDLIKDVLSYIKKANCVNESTINSILRYYTLAYLLEYEKDDLCVLKDKKLLSSDNIRCIFSLKNNYKKLVDKYNDEFFNQKIKYIWNTLLDLKWENTNEDKQILSNMIQAVDEFEFIDEEIVKNIININNFIDDTAGFNYKLCEYFNRVISKDNIELIINCLECYKPEYWDNEIIELFEKIKGISSQKAEDLRNRWLIHNQKDSELKKYFLNIE